MGFGTLLIGYFLMLNITSYVFTDLIAAMIMLLGLYKLSRVSAYFKRAMYAAAGFAVFSLGELAFGIVDLFSSGDLSLAVAYVGMAHAFALGIFTVALLRSIEQICVHLEISKLPARCRTMTIWAIAVYGANIILQTPLITSALPPVVSSVLYLVVIIGMVAVVIIDLTVIYGCYVQICMPEDLAAKPQKPSRFEFVNEYRRRKEEKELEEAEAARRRFEEKMKRRKKK